MLRAAEVGVFGSEPLRGISRVIVMPAHNERGVIADVISQWAAWGGAPLVLVLDRCSDGTDTAVRQELLSLGFDRLAQVDDGRVFGTWFDAGRQSPASGIRPWRRVMVLSARDHQLGKTGAVIQGLWAALAAGLPLSAACCLWDSDGEYALAAVPDVWAMWNEEARISTPLMLVGQREGDLLLRSRLANSLVRLALALRSGRLPPADVLTGVRVARMHDMLMWIQGCGGFAMETKIVREAMLSRAHVASTPVPYFPRTDGKKIGARHLPHLLWAAIA